MSCYEEVIRIGKKLDKMISSKSIVDSIGLDLLNALKKQPMTLDVLQKTRIGMTVNNLRKQSQNDELVTLAKSLIKNWKKLLPEDNANNGSVSSATKKGQTSSASLSRSNSSRLDDNDSRDSQNTMESGARQGSPKSDSSHGGGGESPGSGVGEQGGGGVKSAFVGSAGFTTDTARLKCREMLAMALRAGEQIDGAGDVDFIAAAIEECIYQEFKTTDMKYTNRVRSRITNLKDPKNPRLRENLLLGNISMEKMAKMTSEEMASDAMKNLRAKLTKEAIDDHQMATQAGTKSDLFKCGKCGQRDTMYNQVQTRSADEPMTTFVVCNVCGNRWKFC